MYISNVTSYRTKATLQSAKSHNIQNKNNSDCLKTMTKQTSEDNKTVVL